MIVTSLTNKEVIFDTGEIVEINKFIIYKYSIEEGKELSEEVLEEVKYEMALEEALVYISKYRKTIKEVDLKLKQRGYDKNVREKVKEKIKKEKYIDEYEIVQVYLDNKDFGDDRIRYELSFMGIEKAMIEEAFENRKTTEIDKIEKLLKKIKGKEKRKQIAYLLSRGFCFDNIIEKIGGDQDDY